MKIWWTIDSPPTVEPADSSSDVKPIEGEFTDLHLYAHARGTAHISSDTTYESVFVFEGQQVCVRVPVNNRIIVDFYAGEDEGWGSNQQFESKPDTDRHLVLEATRHK